MKSIVPTLNRIFTNPYVLLATFIVISLSADICFTSRNVNTKPGNDAWVSRPDFRVYWVASRNLDYRVRRFRKDRKLDAQARVDYPVYDDREEFYHFRYSPTMAFIMLPLGKVNYPIAIFSVWTLFINIFFFMAIALLLNAIYDTSHVHLAS